MLNFPSYNVGRSLLVCCILSFSVLSGCKSKSTSSREEDGAPKKAPAVAFEAGPKTAGVLYTWVDADGSFHLTEKAEEIPQERRDQVRIVVDGKSTGSAEYVYVANLNEVHDGQYALSAMPRTEWENLGKAGRDRKLAELAPEKTPGADLDKSLADLGVDAIIYGADWCKPCHLAEDYLKSKGVRVVKKDIEEDPSAAGEMQAVLKSAGLSGSSIPVLNVGGTVLRGFSAKAIDAALERAKAE